jgi:desampylase
MANERCFFDFWTMAAIARHLSCAPVGHEAGGLLAGPDLTHVDHIWAATNAAGDQAHEFRIDPQELATAVDSIEESGKQLLGTFHSHPEGTPDMSVADRGMAYNTGFALIVATFPSPKPWRWALWDPIVGCPNRFSISAPSGTAWDLPATISPDAPRRT